MVTQSAVGCLSSAEWSHLGSFMPWHPDDQGWGSLKAQLGWTPKMVPSCTCPLLGWDGCLVGIFLSSCEAFTGLAGIPHSMVVSAYSDFLHDSWSLPEHVFMKLRQKLGFLCPSLRSHTRSLPLTSIAYTGQPKFNTRTAYTRVWMLRSEGHWEAILKTGYHTFPVSPLLCAPMGSTYAPSSASLSWHYAYFLFFVSLLHSEYLWLVG